MGDMTPNGRHKGVPLTLPPITAMTQGFPERHNHAGNHQSPLFDTRDSGNWSLPSQSKRTSTLSCLCFLHTLLYVAFPFHSPCETQPRREDRETGSLALSVHTELIPAQTPRQYRATPEVFNFTQS